MLLEVEVNLSARLIWISGNSLPQLPCPWGRAAVGTGSGGWRRTLGVVICSAGSTPRVHISSVSLPRRMASSSGVGKVPLSPLIGFRREALTMSSPLRVIRGAIHLWSSHMVKHKTLVGAPDSLAQTCSAWVRARVFSCLTTQKFLGPEASVPDMNSWGQGPPI